MHEGAHFDALRRDLRACIEAAIEAVEPESLVADFLSDRGGGNRNGPVIDSAERVWIAGLGKAAAAMARGALGVLGERTAGGVLVVPAGERDPAAMAAMAAMANAELEVFGGGHPIPNEEGVAGAGAIRRLANTVSNAGGAASDLLLVLISGGGSALMTFPPEGLALEDIQTTTNALLRAGADIEELNTVRKHLDLLKGGQLARAASPARVLALVLSDVVGDPLDVIASGPLSPDPTTFAMAIEVLKRRGVWSEAPAAVRRHLTTGLDGSIPETPVEDDECFRNVVAHIVGNNKMAAEAACAKAAERGYEVELTSTTVTGEAQEVGAGMARTAVAIATGEASRGGAARAPTCRVSAGETTVTVTGGGRGGRNQEVALGAAIALDLAEPEVPILVASVGTDGIDGPTEAAGAMAFPDSVVRARALGLDAEAALADNDSYSFFAALDDLITTGATGTNVMDLQFVMVGASAKRHGSKARP